MVPCVYSIYGCTAFLDAEGPHAQCSPNCLYAPDSACVMCEDMFSSYTSEDGVCRKCKDVPLNIVMDPDADLKVYEALVGAIGEVGPDTTTNMMDLIMDYVGDFGTSEDANPRCPFCGPILSWPCAQCAIDEAAKSWNEEKEKE